MPDQLRDRLLASIRKRPFLERWRRGLDAATRRRLRPGRHGDLNTWLEGLASLPAAAECELSIENGAVTLRSPETLDTQAHRALESGLRTLSPWRKGPFDIFGVNIDSEWRSDMKWARLQPHLGELQGQKILDVGCGNGYFMWRLLDEGASYVLGIDPSVRFLVQYLAVQGYVKHPRIDLLPLRSEDLPADMACFDRVLSLGVIYHRRYPADHLAEQISFLRPGGQLVLETLVIDEDSDRILVPDERYAQMRNVWFIPTPSRMTSMMEATGLRNVRCVDITPTTTAEQRCTDWMQFQSLADFLDPNDPTLTIEGYPAPVRAIFMAEKPE